MRRSYTAKRLRPPAQLCRWAATLGYGVSQRTQPHRGCAAFNSLTQDSRNGNPGLEVRTAARFSIWDSGVEKSWRLRCLHGIAVTKKSPDRRQKAFRIDRLGLVSVGAQLQRKGGRSVAECRSH